MDTPLVAMQESNARPAAAASPYISSTMLYRSLPFGERPQQVQLKKTGPSIPGTYTSSGNIATFTLKSERSFLDLSQSYFEATIIPTCTADGFDNPRIFLEAGIQSIISDLSVSVINGTNLDTIPRYNECIALMHDLGNSTWNTSIGAITEGFAQSSIAGVTGTVTALPGQVTATGVAIGAPIVDGAFGPLPLIGGSTSVYPSQENYTGSHPMISGTAYTFTFRPMGFLNSSKLFPMFLVEGLQIDMTLEKIPSKVLVVGTQSRDEIYDTAHVTALDYTVSNLSFVGKYMSYDDSVNSRYKSIIAQEFGRIELDYSTFATCIDSQLVTAASEISINLPIPAKSMKSIFVAMHDASNRGANDYGRLQPYLSNRTHVSGTNFNLTINDAPYFVGRPMLFTSDNISAVCTELSKAMNKLTSNSHNMDINRRTFTNDGMGLTGVAAYNTQQVGKAALGFDLEIYNNDSESESLSGLNTQAIDSKLKFSYTAGAIGAPKTIDLVAIAMLDAKLIINKDGVIGWR